MFKANRRTVLGARMIAVTGNIKREGEVVQLAAQRIADLSAALASQNAFQIWSV